MKFINQKVTPEILGSLLDGTITLHRTTEVRKSWTTVQSSVASKVGKTIASEQLFIDSLQFLVWTRPILHRQRPDQWT